MPGVEPDAEIRDLQNRPSRLNAGTPMDVLSAVLRAPIDFDQLPA